MNDRPKRVSARAKPRPFSWQIPTETRPAQLAARRRKIRAVAENLLNKHIATCATEVARYASVKVSHAKSILRTMEKQGILRSVRKDVKGTGLGRRWYFRRPLGSQTKNQNEKSRSRGQ